MIKIYRNIVEVEQVSKKNAVHHSAIMGLDEVRISVVIDRVLDIEEGDYILHNGIRYVLNRDAEYEIRGDVNYSYDLIFEHPQYTLINKLLVNKITGSTNLTLTGKLIDFVSLAVWGVNKSAENLAGVDAGWSIGNIIDTDYKTITIEDLDCRESLKLFAKEFDVEYYFTGIGKTINFAERIENVTPLVFEQGREKGLYKITQRNVDKEDTVTRVYVRGGNQNVPNAYADEEGYLKLPENYLENFSEHSKVVERKMKFEEEFPHFLGTATTVSGGNNRVITCPAIDFDVQAIVVGDTARINFLTGDLMGNSFEFSWNNALKQITLIDKEDETALPDVDGLKPSIPSSTKQAKVGDKFNFTGLLMPIEYVNASITRLRAKGSKWLEFYSKKRVKFTIDIDYRWMRDKDPLNVGDLVVISIPQRSFSQVIRITELEYNLRTGAISATVSNYLEESWDEYLKDRITDVRNEILAKQVNFRNTLETIFKDGIVTETELKSIEAILTNLSVERGQLNAQYLVVRGNNNLTNKTPLEAAWSNYQTAFVEVETAINNAIADKLVSDAEKANIENKISVYSTRTNEFVTALENARGAIEDYKNQGLLDVVEQNKQYLQQQIDGEISNYYQPYKPTLANYPASEWTTNLEKDRHIGDLFLNIQAYVDDVTTPDAGKAWRFIKDGTTYLWTPIADSDTVKAMKLASQAQSTADGKSTTYLIQPTKYSLGDMWVLNTDTTVNGISYKSGEILTATQDSTTYNQAHWVKKVRYTDQDAIDKSLGDLEIGGINLLDGTSDGWTTVTTTSTPYTNNFFKDTVLEVGQEYILSFESEIISGTPSGVVHVGCGTTDYQKDILYSTVPIIGKRSIKFKPTSADLATHKSFAFRWYNNGAIFTFRYRKLKLEKGSKATDWDLSKKDRQDKIDLAKQEAENAAKSYTNTKSEAERVLAEAYADGKVTAEEQARIDDVNAKLAAAKAYAEAQDALLKTQQEAYADGKASAAELAAIAAAEAYANLKKTEAEAYADGKVSAEEARAIADATAKFNDAKAHADTIVNNIQIGGRNLFSVNNFVADNKARGYSTIEVIQHEGNIAYRSTNITNNHNVPRYLQGKFEANTQYYFKFNILWESFTDSGAQYIFTIRYTDGSSSTLAATTSQTSRSLLTTAGKTIDYITTTRQFDGTVVVYSIQIKKENKLSDWIIAQEDVQVNIDKAQQDAINAKLTAEQAQLQAEGFMRARYVRDWLKGNTDHNTNNWSEIKVVNKAGVNLALGLPANNISANGTWHANYPKTNVIDGNTSTQGYISQTTPTLNYVQIDLGQIHYDIDYIGVWHAGWPTRLYYGTKTEISEDGVNWTTIFDSAVEGTYVETAEGKIHTQRYASVISKLNQSKAITDKFGTDITGGLITTVMMLLREVNSQINTAGFSGIQKDANGIANQPSYWSGGTHEQAQAFVPFVKKLENEQSTSLAEYNNLPKIVFLHSGAAKVGHFIVLTSGEILIVDPSTGSVKLKFTTAELPSITDLVTGTNSQGSTAVGAGVASISSSQVVSGSTQVSKNGAIATFNGTHISLSARGIAQAGGMASFAEAVLYARQNGVRVQRLASVAVHFTNTVYEDMSAEVLPVPFSFPLDAGTYTFELVIHTTGTISSGNAVTSASNLSWKHTVAGVKKQQYSKDGMMFFYSNRHFYFSELTGLDVKESDSSKFNMPGVLLSATVNENGGWNRVWGAKQSLTQPPLPSRTGRYTIYHTIGHTNYQVNCVSYTENRSFRVYQKNTNNVIVECRTIGSTPVLVNAMFDIILTGNNY